jgi:signal transduction histidine kinase
MNNFDLNHTPLQNSLCMINDIFYKRLRYEHEVLWALSEIKDHYLNRVAGEVADNISQVLYLVRVHLSRLSLSNKYDDTSISEPGELIGKAIHDLRYVRSNTNTETELLKKAGLVKTLEYELNLVSKQEDLQKILVTGIPFKLAFGTELIIFRIIQEIIFSTLVLKNRENVSIKVWYNNDEVKFEIEYTGSYIEVQETLLNASTPVGLPRLNFAERAEVIEGHFKAKTNTLQLTRIELKIPSKISYYE